MPTPDDIAGGVTDTDLIILNDTGADPTSIGEITLNNGKYKGMDDVGVFDLRVAGGGDDRRVKVSANDAVPAYLLEKLVAVGGIQLTEAADGADEKVEIKTGFRSDSNLRVADAPTTPSGQSSNSFAEIGALFWDGDALEGVPTDYVIAWYGWIEQGSADYEIKLTLASDGTVLGSNSLTGNNGNQTSIVVTLDSLLIPTIDDAFVVEHKSSGGGSGSVVFAGHFLVGPAP